MLKREQGEYGNRERERDREAYPNVSPWSHDILCLKGVVS